MEKIALQLSCSRQEVFDRICEEFSAGGGKKVSVGDVVTELAMQIPEIKITSTGAKLVVFVVRSIWGREKEPKLVIVPRVWGYSFRMRIDLEGSGYCLDAVVEEVGRNESVLRVYDSGFERSSIYIFAVFVFYPTILVAILYILDWRLIPAAAAAVALFWIFTRRASLDTRRHNFDVLAEYLLAMLSRHTKHIDERRPDHLLASGLRNLVQALGFSDEPHKPVNRAKAQLAYEQMKRARELLIAEGRLHSLD